MSESTHALNRTSPKGQDFVGTCFKCGQTGLPARAVGWACENPANFSTDESLMLAVKGQCSADEA